LSQNGIQIVDRVDLAGREESHPEAPGSARSEASRASAIATVKLPVTLAAAVEGVTAELEQLAGHAELLIRQAVMEAEVQQLAGPKSGHKAQRSVDRWGIQKGYALLGAKKVPLVRD